MSYMTVLLLSFIFDTLFYQYRHVERGFPGSRGLILGINSWMNLMSLAYVALWVLIAIKIGIGAAFMYGIVAIALGLLLTLVEVMLSSIFSSWVEVLLSLSGFIVQPVGIAIVVYLVW